MELTSFVNSIRPFLPGCPDFVMKEELVKSIRQFCEDTFIWIDPAATTISGDNSTTEFTLSLDTENADLITILEITDSDDNSYTKFTFDVNTMALVFDTAPPSDTLTVKAAVKPTSSVTTVSDFFANWSEAIQDLTRYRLMTVPGKKWSNPQQAEHHYRMYRRARSKIILKRLKQYTAQSLTAQPKEFFNVGI